MSATQEEKTADSAMATPTPASTDITIRITSAQGKDYEARTTAMMAEAFATDPVFTYFLNHLPQEKRLIARRKLYHVLFSLFALEGGIFYEASIAPAASESHAVTSQPQFHSAVIVARPGPKLDWFASLKCIHLMLREGMIPFMFLVGPRKFFRMKTEHADVAEPFKEAYFQKTLGRAGASADDFYEVKYVATDAQYRGKGLAPVILRDVLKMAGQEGKPVWIEASNAKARRQYQKCGFKDAGKAMLMGKGRCDADGEKARGDKAVGVQFWPLVWWPEGDTRGDIGNMS
jgi:GNAT superfamily N-acetyltransferase